MRTIAATLLFVTAMAADALAQSASTQQAVFPGRDWERIAAPEALGYSTAGLAAARARLATMATTGLVAVVGGRILFEYGDVDTVSYLASVRKSVLSMLYGIYVGRGVIDLDMTLAQLGIDDVQELTTAEKQARIRHLLAARSGIYHPASNAGDDLASAPPRGSQQPGAYYLYSNWDFNALGTIFEQLTKQSIYDALQRDIVEPIGMQDFNRAQHRRSGDASASRHLAYHMHFSTRDMARLGYLMLRGGNWNGRQIVPAAWVRESTRAITPVTELNPATHRSQPWGYGYLWWVWDGPNTPEPYRGAFTGIGAVGQYITVVPALDLVVAHKTVPGERQVSTGEFLTVLDLIVRAKVPLAERVEIQVPDSVLRRYVGEYELAPGAVMLITLDEGRLYARLNEQSMERIYPESPTKFFYRVVNAQISFTVNDAGVVTGLILHQSGGRTNPARKRLLP
jgi:CubicO group peptidase (beta-lactamase class C family)